MTAGWNFADLWEAIADHLPDAQATVHDRRSRTWAGFSAAGDTIAAALLEHGVSRDGTFAQYLYNGPEYLAAVLAERRRREAERFAQIHGPSAG